MDQPHSLVPGPVQSFQTGSVLPDHFGPECIIAAPGSSCQAAVITLETWALTASKGADHPPVRQRPSGGQSESNPQPRGWRRNTHNPGRQDGDSNSSSITLDTEQCKKEKAPPVHDRRRLKLRDSETDLTAPLLGCAVPRPLLASPLARQRRFHPLLLAGLQVERVTLDVLNNVLLQDLALEPLQRALQALAFMELYFCQRISPRIPTDCQIPD